MIEQQPRVTMDTATLEAAVARARRVLLSTQRADGSWNTESDSGVACTAEVLIVLRYIGALASDDAAEAVRWLRAQQRANGSFVRYPFAEAGDATTTALAWAALIAAGAPATDPVVARAHGFVEAHGGLAAALDQFRRGDLAPIFLAIAGQIPASRFPSPPLAFSLVPPLMRLLERRFHAGILMMTLEIGVLLRRLRGDWGPDGTRKGPIATKACHRTLALLDTFQNLEGSFDAETMITALGIAALHAIGIPNSDPRLVKALDWLRQRRQHDHTGAWFSSFQGPVWSTAFDVRALLASGLAATDPRIAQALDWLADAQILIPQPAVNNTHAGAPRVGGYAFQPTNETMPDCDDAGVVLSAFGLALAQGVSADVEGRITQASRLAQEWLFGMQNPDGGWSAFVYGLPSKPPGPIFTKPVGLSPDDPAALLRAFLRPPPELGDPSTEDVTARVLLGLGRHGHTTREEAIGRAAEFLRTQQCPSGAWWGRWTNYVSSTAFVLLGLASVQADLRAPWVRRGVQWLRSMQNDDSGWSDNPAAYADPALAGRGHSMPPLTALVVTMLVEIGEGDSDTAARAVRYLLEQQRADGTWLNGDYLHTYIPPDTHYYYSEAARFYPLETLGRYLAHCGAPARADDVGVDRYTDSMLVTMRRVADPVADEVVQALFDRGEVGAANAIFQAIVGTDDPVPVGLPDVALQYFERTAALPPWADPQQMAIAQALFVRAGWHLAMALFCSSLPQAYAARDGAIVLVQTQAMTRQVRRRIFETAQFLFDVMTPGALSDGGRGVRTAQKVRLMHAAVRHLLLATGRWDTPAVGLPINQEDMAGTLMTFSLVTVDALARVRIPVSAAEREAWIHTWNVVGFLLGIREELLPASVAESAELTDAIRRRHWAPSAAGAELARAVVDMMQEYLPGAGFDGVPVALVRYLAGDHCADLLGLSRADWTRHLVDAGSDVATSLRIGEHRSPRGALIRRATFLLMRAIVRREREGKRAQFRIPAALLDSLGADD